MISIKIVGIFLASILGTSVIFGMEEQSLEKMLPKDMWYCIAEYLSGDDAFLNRELVRHFSFNDDVYDKIVKSYLEKKCSFYPAPDEIAKMIEDNFTTAHGNSNLQENIRNAFEHFIEEHPYSKFQGPLKDTNFEEFVAPMFKELQKELHFKSSQVKELSSLDLERTYKRVLNRLTLLQKCREFIKIHHSNRFSLKAKAHALFWRALPCGAALAFMISYFKKPFPLFSTKSLVGVGSCLGLAVLSAYGTVMLVDKPFYQLGHQLIMINHFDQELNSLKTALEDELQSRKESVSSLLKE
jgi:hypothetical protein